MTAYKEYFKQQFGQERSYVAPFIQMEIRRSFLRNLIGFYFVLNLPQIRTFGEAVRFWSNKYKSSELKAVLQLVGDLADGHRIDRNRPRDKEIALQGLAVYIKRLDMKLRTRFKNVGKDSARCARAAVLLKPPLDDLAGGLRQFLDEFNDVEECRNQCRIDKFLLERYRAQVEAYVKQALGTPSSKESKGFLEIAASLKEILAEGPSACSCKRCESIGDAVVALDAPRDMRLEHTDHSFDHLCPSIKQPHFKHPSEPAIVTRQSS